MPSKLPTDLPATSGIYTITASLSGSVDLNDIVQEMTSAYYSTELSMWIAIDGEGNLTDTNITHLVTAWWP